MSDLLSLGDPAARRHILLAHGAGAPMTSPFMSRISALLAARGLSVSLFEFAYMARRRVGGPRSPPPRTERLAVEYMAMAERVSRCAPAGQRHFIGGKSLGGRVASLIADQLFRRGQIAGLVCLGYPFHPPGRPGRTRAAHLAALPCPHLVVQGERDPFGGRSEFEAMIAAGTLPAMAEVWWAPDGDHDLCPRARSGTTQEANLSGAADAIAAFTRRLAPGG